MGYKVCSLLNFTVLLLKSISYYEQYDSQIEWNNHDKQINKNTKLLRQWLQGTTIAPL